MPKAKRKTLPKNFKELIEAGDMAALKAVFDTCELDAHGGYAKGSALHFYDVPDELVRWLVERGLNVDSPDLYGRTPLYEKASIGSEQVALLLDLGADIGMTDQYKGTPIHIAAGDFHVDTVRLLMERGADIHAKNESGQTPLAYALARCEGMHIPNMADIAALLLDAGAKLTPEMAASVERIGKSFEFHREAFNKDYLAETEAGLQKLYGLFGVEAVARRRTHDGVSSITVVAARWQEQHQELWEYLVPSRGACKTVQGEVIRVTGRLSREIMDNGGGNWDADFRKMCDALIDHFASGASLAPAELGETAALIKTIRPQGDGDEEPERLCELAVKWVLQNPEPIVLKTPAYKR